MTKRAIFSKDKFRISAPGVDVDSADDHQFILHESHLAAQPYWTKWVPCPFADYTGNQERTATVPIPPPPAILPNTTILMYKQGTTQNNYYPSTIAPAGAFDAWFIELRGDLTTKTDLSLYFAKQRNATSPRGVWVIYMRNATS